MTAAFHLLALTHDIANVLLYVVVHPHPGISDGDVAANWQEQVMDNRLLEFHLALLVLQDDLDLATYFTTADFGVGLTPLQFAEISPPTEQFVNAVANMETEGLTAFIIRVDVVAALT